LQMTVCSKLYPDYYNFSCTSYRWVYYQPNLLDNKIA